MRSLRQEIALDGFESNWESQKAGTSLEQGAARSFLGILLGLGLGLCAWTALCLLVVFAFL